MSEDDRTPDELRAQVATLVERMTEAEERARHALAGRGRLEAALVERDAEIDRLRALVRALGGTP